MQAEGTHTPAMLAEVLKRLVKFDPSGTYVDGMATSTSFWTILDHFGPFWTSFWTLSAALRFSALYHPTLHTCDMPYLVPMLIAC